jgi:hypothetical protein
MGGVARCLFQRGHDQGFDVIVGDRTRHARPRLVVESLKAISDETATVRAENVIRSAELGRRGSRRDGTPTMV